MKYAHVLGIVIEADHNSTASLFRSSFETQQVYVDSFFSTFDGLSQKN